MEVCIPDREPVAAACNQVANTALQRKPSFVNDGNLVAERFHFAQKMRIDKDCDSAVREAVQNIADVPTTYGINAIGRFVKNKQPRLMNKSLRQAEPLQHAF